MAGKLARTPAAAAADARPSQEARGFEIEVFVTGDDWSCMCSLRPRPRQRERERERDRESESESEREGEGERGRERERSWHASEIKGQAVVRWQQDGTSPGKTLGL